MQRGHIADPEWVRSNGEVNFDEDTASNRRTIKRQGQQRGAAPSSCEMAGSGGQGSQETNVRRPTLHSHGSLIEVGRGAYVRTVTEDVLRTTSFCALKSPPVGRRPRLGYPVLVG
ncbi:hypothetical protein CSAL01_12060 [Colletotrichum salicis]|uniref:Uncharacterized protein n=1 Tax=Colletotrichum salicis TaxID=1209931 RepID=A0A135TYJ6_9PEZI|nr:hypothetical protein CSAL01_12060 [Colletotrichum salicis]